MTVAANSISPSVVNELRAIVGAENIVTGDQELLVYECDAYTLEKSLPNVVVLPRTTAEVAAVVKLCARPLTPITSNSSAPVDLRQP